MELPHGIREKHHVSGLTLQELNSSMSKKAMTGYVLVRADESGTTGTIVYSKGLPVLGFVSDGQTDRADNGLAEIEALMKSGKAGVELFKIREHQLGQILDAYGSFEVHPPVNGAGHASPGTHHPGHGTHAHPSEPSLPEIRGRFIKAINASCIQAFLQGNSGFTGHVILNKKSGHAHREYHFLVVRGSVVASYSAQESVAGKALYDRLAGETGVIELYYVDQPEISALLEKYPGVSLNTVASGAPEAGAGAQNHDPGAGHGEGMAPVQPVEQHPSGGARVSAEPLPGAVSVEPSLPATVPETAVGDRMSQIGIDPGHGEGMAPVQPVEQHPSGGARVSAEPLPGAVSVEPSFPVAAPEPTVDDEPSQVGIDPGQGETFASDLEYIRKVEQEFSGDVEGILSAIKLSHLCVRPRKKA